jgi:hypothetical protein
MEAGFIYDEVATNETYRAEIEDCRYALYYIITCTIYFNPQNIQERA